MLCIFYVFFCFCWDCCRYSRTRNCATYRQDVSELNFYFSFKSIGCFRKIDDAVGATAIHLVNGVWGQLSVGLFADPESGPKGIFLGGGFYQLIVQAISAISLSIWAASATIAILWIVNKIIEIRLEPDEEMQGSDLIEHDIITNLTYSSEEQNNREIIDKDLNDLSSVERFSGPIDDRNRQNIVFGRRQTFHTNQSFERD